LLALLGAHHIFNVSGLRAIGPTDGLDALEKREKNLALARNEAG